MMFCLDTSAWFDFFNAGPHGTIIRELIDGEEAVLTPAVVAAQVIEAARRRRENSKTFLQFLQSRTRIVPVTPEIARLAGKINAARSSPDNSWSMLESLILATARHHHARLITKDPLFAGIPNVDVLTVTDAA